MPKDEAEKTRRLAVEIMKVLIDKFQESDPNQFANAMLMARDQFVSMSSDPEVRKRLRGGQ